MTADAMKQLADFLGDGYIYECRSGQNLRRITEGNPFPTPCSDGDLIQAIKAKLMLHGRHLVVTHFADFVLVQLFPMYQIEVWEQARNTEFDALLDMALRVTSRLPRLQPAS